MGNKIIARDLHSQEESYCCLDFCGYTSPGHFLIQYWADWYPNDKGRVIFGGDFSEVPDMFSRELPTEERCRKWARRHCEAIRDIA